MYTARTLAVLVVGIALVGAVCSAAQAGSVDRTSWLATGTVTKVGDGTLCFLSRSNTIYRVDISRAITIFPGGGAGDQIRVGDKVRIFGCKTGADTIEATRVRVFGRAAAGARGPEKEIKVIVQPEPEPVMQPAPAAEAPIPQPLPPVNWQGKGLITDVDYVGETIKMQTTCGNVTIYASNAIFSRGSARIGFGRLNLGDTICVSGNSCGPNEVYAQAVRVLRTVSEAQNAVPLNPISIVGIIQQVDYVSQTFKMMGESTAIVVSCDANTVIQFQQCKKCFSDLKPGTKVSMTGYGSLATGYSALHVQIIGVSP